MCPSFLRQSWNVLSAILTTLFITQQLCHYSTVTFVCQMQNLGNGSLIVCLPYIFVCDMNWIAFWEPLLPNGYIYAKTLLSHDLSDLVASVQQLPFAKLCINTLYSCYFKLSFGNF